MIVGLTGGIGSGKTTVTNFFKSFDSVAVYIADEEAQKLTNTSKNIASEIRKTFGEEVYKNNTLDRNYLASIVFNSAKKLAKLNTIIHPEVHKHFKEFITKNNQKQYIIYESAILFENQSNRLCDLIITVTAPLKTRLNRVIKRDTTTKKQVLSRMKNQWTDEKKTLQSNYIINNIQLEDTKKQVNTIHNILTKKSITIS